jgi:hypothetical protein
MGRIIVALGNLIKTALSPCPFVEEYFDSALGSAQIAENESSAYIVSAAYFRNIGSGNVAGIRKFLFTCFK